MIYMTVGVNCTLSGTSEAYTEYAIERRVTNFLCRHLEDNTGNENENADIHAVIESYLLSTCESNICYTCYV